MIYKKIVPFLSLSLAIAGCSKFDGASTSSNGPHISTMVSSQNSPEDKQELVQTYSANCNGVELSESQREYLESIAAAPNREEQKAMMEQLRRELALNNQQFGNACISICHVPPGNPAAQHTIRIGLPAIVAHLNHGCKGKHPSRDYLGECGQVPPDEDDGDTGGSTGEESGGTTGGDTGGTSGGDTGGTSGGSTGSTSGGDPSEF